MILTIALAFVFIPSQILVKKATVRKYQMYGHLYEDLCRQKSEDCVWKFARAKLWISFIEPGTTLSIPFDIIPTPIAVVRLFQGLRTVFLINRAKEESHSTSF
ncbi:short transient receptor potential channel 3 [Biomphalaria glabrata]